MPETPATTDVTTPPTAIVFPPGRYGRRRETRRSPRWRVAILALAVAAAAAYVGVSLYRAYGDGNYSASVTGFSDVTDNQVVVTFLVRIPEGAAASCTVRARDASGVEVGRAQTRVLPGPDPGRTIATYRLVTTGRPVTGEVQGCRPA